MKLYTLMIKGGSPIAPTFGFVFSNNESLEAVLDDNLIEISLDPQIDLDGTDSAPIIIEDGFVSLPKKVLVEDVSGDSDRVLVHLKVRLDNSSPPCVIEVNTEHKPLVGFKESERVKTFVFQITPEASITIKLGRATYLFRCVSGELLMNDLTTPSWPLVPPPVLEESISTTSQAYIPRRSWWRWWSFSGKGKRHRRKTVIERRIEFVHVL